MRKSFRKLLKQLNTDGVIKDPLFKDLEEFRNMRNKLVHSRTSIFNLSPMELISYTGKSSKSRNVTYQAEHPVQMYPINEVAEIGITLFFQIRKLFLS